MLDSAASAVSQSFGVGERQYLYAVAGLESLAAGVAAGGALPGAGVVEQYMSGLSGAENYFSDGREFALAQAAVSRNIDLLRQEQGRQLSDAEQLLAALDDRKQQAQSNHDAMLARNEAQFERELAAAESEYALQVEALEKQLAYFEAEVSLLRGIDAGLPALEMAIVQMQSAMAAEQEANRRLSDAHSEQLQVSMAALEKHTRDTADAVSELVDELRGAA